MSVKRNDAWVLDALGWSIGRGIGIAAVSAGYVFYLVASDAVMSREDKQMVDGGFIKPFIAFMIVMAVADVIAVLLREKPLALSMGIVGVSTAIAVGLAYFFGSRISGLVLLLLGSVPQFFFGPIRALVFQSRMVFPDTRAATDEPWPLYRIRGSRVLTKTNFVADDVKRPHATRWRWFYTYEMTFIHKDDLPFWASGHRYIVTLYVVWVELDHNGTFRVTWEPQLRYLCPEKDKPMSIVRFLGIKPNELKQTIVECSGDDVKAFSLATASEVELSKPSLEHYRQGRLLFMEHDLIRVELRNKPPVTIARDFRWGRGGAEEQALKLSAEFKPPSDGWNSMLGPSREKHRVEQEAVKNRATAFTFWNGPALVPIVAHGRKFSAPIDEPFHESVLSVMRGNKDWHMKRLSAVLVPVFSDAPPSVRRDGDTETNCCAAAYLPFVMSCIVDGEAVEYGTHTDVNFYPPSFNLIYKHSGDTVRVDVITDKAFRTFIVQLSKVSAFKIARAGDLKMPDNYLFRSDGIKSDDALVPYIECTDGVIVPLAYTTKMRREILEKWLVVLKEAQTTCHLPTAKTSSPPPTGHAPVSEDFDPI